jgi:lipoprotein-anchoring transpeptidase ErfK/SrfK
MNRRTMLRWMGLVLAGALEARLAHARRSVVERNRDRLTPRAVAFHRQAQAKLQSQDAVADTAPVAPVAPLAPVAPVPAVIAVPAPVRRVPAEMPGAAGPQPEAQSPAAEARWIEVRLATQRLIAWQNGQVVMNTAVSSGVRNTPTVTGSFRIGYKVAKTRMRGPGYDLPNVPHAMFFYKDYAIHGAYWHNSFGRPMSHGCVNLPPVKAAWLFDWAPRGTLVVVH